MGEKETTRAAAAGDLQILVEELLGLALDGTPEAALRRVEAAAAGAADSSAGLAIELLRNRLAIRHGSDHERAEAARSLRRIAEGDAAHGWRARLELSRMLRRAGKVAEAATVLRQALEEFRGSPASSGPATAALAQLLTDEAETIHRRALSPDHPEEREPADADGSQGRSSFTSSPVDPQLLLRLIDLGRRMATETDPGNALRVILHEAIDLAAAERGFLVLTSGDRLDFTLAENLDWSEVEDPSFEVSRTLVREVGATGRAAFLSLADLPSDHPMTASLGSRGVHAVACVPMVGSAGTVGVLYLDRRHAAGSFSGARRGVLELFAAQAAAALENARAHAQKVRELEAAHELARRRQPEETRRTRYETLIGVSAEMQELFQRLDLIVPTEMPVVILGETGTGKELVAHVIHERGPRRDGAFVAINCAGLAESLLESELFGHEKGAFTGADRARPGLFEVAHRGTLFLDEVGDMSPRMQGELLRAVQSGEVRRLGGREAFHVDVRVVAATHQDLEEKVREGKFREDLFYRLNVLTLALPPLRERVEDIPLLAAEILTMLARGGTPPTFSPDATRLLAAFAWPGNVRQLENVLRRLTVLGVPTIEPEHLPEEIRRFRLKPSPAGTLRQAETEAIRLALETTAGNKAEAARILGVDRKTLHAKLKRGPGA